MDRVRFAESVLSLAVSPERAQTILGDLIETDGGRGFLWFWLSVLRTTFGLAARGLTGEPAIAIRAALGGIVWQFVYTLAFFIPVLILGMFLGRIVPMDFMMKYFYPSVWLTQPFSLYLVGRRIARRSMERALTAWLAFAIMDAVIEMAVVASVRDVTAASLVAAAGSFALYQGAILIGVVVTRHRSLRFQAP